MILGQYLKRFVLYANKKKGNRQKFDYFKLDPSIVDIVSMLRYIQISKFCEL